MATTFSLKQRETRTGHGPIPHPLRDPLVFRNPHLAYISFTTSIQTYALNRTVNMHGLSIQLLNGSFLFLFCFGLVFFKKTRILRECSNKTVKRPSSDEKMLSFINEYQS